MAVQWGPDLFEEERPEERRDRVAVRLEELATRVESGHDMENSRIQTLVKDIRAGASWRMFGDVDGPAAVQYMVHPTQYEEAQERGKRVREWATETLGEPLIDEIGNLAAEAAFWNRGKGGGFIQGNTVLFERAFDMPESRFQQEDSFDADELRIYLNNGRMYEHLLNMTIGVNHGQSLYAVANVLTYHYRDLDPEQVKRGLEIIGDNRCIWQADFFFLPPACILAYHHFMEEVHVQRDQLGLSIEDLGPITRPYIRALVQSDEYHHRPCVPFGAVRMLQEDWVQEHIDADAKLRERLSMYVAHEISEQNSELGRTALEALQQHGDVVAHVAKDAGLERVRRLITLDEETDRILEATLA